MIRIAGTSSTPRWLRVAWTLVVTLSLALVASIEYLRHRHVAGLLAYSDEQQMKMPVYVRETERFFRDPALRRARHRDQLAKALFAGRTPTTLPARIANEVCWADTERGLTYYIGFDASGRATNFGVGPLPPPPTSWLLSVKQSLDPYWTKWSNSSTLTGGAVVWMAVVAASFFRTRFSRPLAQAHIALAWIWLLIWLLHPMYPISFDGIFRNSSFVLAAVMLVASMFANAFIMSRVPQVGAPSCRACSYDLTGNISGICPECGTPIQERRTEIVAT